MGQVFIRRDIAGRIVAASLEPFEGFSEQMMDSSRELAFFASDLAPEQVQMAGSDLGLVRVLEDVVELLIAKGVICFTDLPQAAQEKLLGRQTMRVSLKGLDLLSDKANEIV